MTFKYIKAAFDLLFLPFSLALISGPVMAQDDLSTTNQQLSELPWQVVRRLGGANTTEEYSAGISRDFRTVADSQGVLTKEDAAALTEFAKARRRSDAAARLLAYDMNGDGTVTAAEVTRGIALSRGNGRSASSEQQAAQLAQIMRADLNRDDTITLAEMLRSQDADSDDDMGGSQTAATLMLLDMDGDGVLTLSELRVAARKIFALVDPDGDGELTEAEAAKLQADLQSLGERRRQSAMIAGCRVPKPEAGQQIIIFTAGRTIEVPRISLVGQQGVTGTAALDIEPGAAPLWLLVGSGNPTIWRITGATDRVARLVVLPGQGEDRFEAGVTGLPADKVTFVDAKACQLQRLLENESQRSSVLSHLLGRNPDIEVAAHRFYAASLPSGGVFEAAPVPTTEQAALSLDIWQKAQRFGSAPIVELDLSQVIATGPLESYEILPGDTGIAELMRAGSIVSRPRQSFVGPDNQPLKMASPYRGNFFEIVKPIPRFPAGLSGQDAVTFVLADGVPMPGGNPGMSCVLDGKTGQPLNESPICRRRR